MPVVDVIDLSNSKVGEVELADSVFAAEINDALLHEAVRHYRASARAGTHKTKGRGEVSGSGRKLWRQKGTGRARMGSIRSPLWRHGGTVHGPVPRDYGYKLNKKMVVGALRSALTARLNDGALKIVKEFALDSHKTREFFAVLGKIGAGRSTLLVDNGENRNLALSSRNIPGVTLISTRELHPYHLLGHELIVLSQPSAEKCAETFAPPARMKRQEEA